MKLNLIFTLLLAMKLNLIFTLLLLPALAFGQDDISLDPRPIGNGKYLGARTANGQGVVPVLGMDSSDNSVWNCLSGKECRITIAKTPIARVSSTGIKLASVGQQITSAVLPPVMTPALDLTPAPASFLTARVSKMATASPTLAYVVLPAATAHANESFGVYNPGASPLLFLLSGGVAATDLINVSAAATPFSCATNKFCDCRVIGTSSYMCVAQ